MAVQVLDLEVGEERRGRDVVGGEDQVGEGRGGVAEARAGGGGEGGGGVVEGKGEEVAEDGAREPVLHAAAGDGVELLDGRGAGGVEEQEGEVGGAVVVVEGVRVGGGRGDEDRRDGVERGPGVGEIRGPGGGPLERVAEDGAESGVGVVDGEGVGDGGEVGGRGEELGVGQVDAADGGGEEGLEDVSNQTSESGAVLWGSVDAVLCDATSNHTKHIT